ncbi:MAG: CDP-diacylglycerol--serine O-phosphatidyltransferase [Bacteroidetes bacterium]|nr:CDP-diacylglycerol--serine O-phosphatidyltransferase [Bacteroidota bacterium]
MIRKNIPNFFTLCNLFSGCIAIVFAFEGNLVWSAYMVGFSCVFDFLDGLVARALKVNSEIGKQLDSLADMVSFGVVPGIIIFQLLKMNASPSFIHFWFDDIIPATIAFIITIFSSIRLAKFNLDTRQSDSFIGLPTPANTIFIASLPIILQMQYDNETIKQFIINPDFLISLSLISSFLLIAPLSLFALKFKNFSWADNKVRYIFLLLSVVLLVIFKFMGIPLIIILYIVLSIINNFVAKKFV